MNPPKQYCYSGINPHTNQMTLRNSRDAERDFCIDFILITTPGRPPPSTPNQKFISLVLNQGLHRFGGVLSQDLSDCL